MASVHVTVFVLLLLFDRSFTQVTVNVEELGEIEGNEYDFNGNLMNEFLGVPYAEPPVGEFRFTRPRPKVAWTEKINATTFGASCPQPPVEGLDDLQISEDCLFLNIFVPPNNATADNKLPVMLLIPGRGYRVYSGSEYIGREMAVTGSIIIVTINYRFLTFGFFSTDDDTAPGNYGLWDQRLAIEWVRDNIGAFNGNGSKITIVGQGREGATGVVSQILTPLNNNGLFQRAIVQSSTATDVSYISAEGQATRLSKILVDSLNCEQGSWTENLACLREKSWQDIVAVNYSVLGGYFEPRIDGYFFPDSLDNLLDRDLTHQYDLLAGINSDEGAVLLNGYVDINEAFKTVQDVWNFAYYDTRQRHSSDDKAILEMNAIDYRYDGPLLELPDRESALCFMFEMYGDRSYVSRTIKLLRNHQLSPNTNTFMYYFDYVDQNFTLIDDPLRDFTMAVQGEELFYLWDTIFGRQTALTAVSGSTSESLRANMIQYWTNFVKNGDPNTGSANQTQLTDWPKFNDNTESYLLISNTIQTGQSLWDEYVSFWLDYIPELTQSDDADTCSLVAPASDILRGAEAEPDEFVVIDVTSGNSELGQVRGILRRADEGVGGRETRSFRGIPYASPPVGERRFQYSEVLTDWGQGGIRNATESSAGCPQPIFFPILGAMEYNEDCLYLNIFAPVFNQTSGVGLPVIVYLHSGQFTTGNGVVFDGTTLASYAEAVVVTLNYRIGALGFLSTGDDAAPGNYGIMDVVTALQWIKRYIGSFGGDAGSVTALGMGSGAQIAHLIPLNGLNDGLMHKIIALGDSVLSPTVLTSRDPLQFAIQLASALNCPSGPTTALVTCLRTKSATEILQAPVGGANLILNSFFPVLDGTFLKDSADKILASGDYENIPILAGATECDNTIITALYLNASNGCPDELFAGAIIDDAVDIFYGGKDEFASLFKMFYLKSDLSPTVPNIDCKVGQQISEFLSDLLLNVPLLETGKLMARFEKEMYLYFLTFHPDNHVYQLVLPAWVEASFGDDFPYAFGWPYDRQTILQSTKGYSPIDRKVSINFMEMISTFAKTGVPSANPTDPEAVWQPYDPLQYNALHLDVCPTQEPIPRAEEKHFFWYTVIAGLKETLIDDDEPTSTPASTTCMVDSFIGLELTSVRAGRVIGALVITLGIIAGLIFLAIFIKLCLAIERSYNKPV